MMGASGCAEERSKCELDLGREPRASPILVRNLYSSQEFRKVQAMTRIREVMIGPAACFLTV